MFTTSITVLGNTLTANLTGSVFGSASYAESASYVPLLAGPNITINYQTNGIAITGSAGGSGATFVGATNVDNRLITATGATPELNGEANLTFNGSTLGVTGNITATSFTGSLQGTSSWANNASTSSYVNGMITKNNAVAGGSFAGNPKKATVTFSTAFPNTNYSIVVTGEEARSWTIESKLAGSFVINTNSNTVLSNNVYWQAISYGEFNQ